MGNDTSLATDPDTCQVYIGDGGEQNNNGASTSSHAPSNSQMAASSNEEGKEVIDVDEISTVNIGRIVVALCGEPEKWPSNDNATDLIRRMLQAANTFIPQANEKGANLKRTTFIFNIPGREFKVKSGEDWTFVFSLGGNDEITQASCTQMPLIYWLWDKVKRIWTEIVRPLLPTIGGRLLPITAPH